MPIPRAPGTAAHLGQGIAYPLAVNDKGRLALSSGNQSVSDALSAIFQTEPGERAMQPDNGAAVGVHEPVTDTSEMERAARQVIAEHEPRVVPESIGVLVNRVGADGVLQVQVAYEIVGEVNQRTITFPFWKVG